jgi:hypothetical protein
MKVCQLVENLVCLDRHVKLLYGCSIEQFGLARGRSQFIKLTIVGLDWDEEVAMLSGVAFRRLLNVDLLNLLGCTAPTCDWLFAAIEYSSTLHNMEQSLFYNITKRAKFGYNLSARGF